LSFEFLVLSENLPSSRLKNAYLTNREDAKRAKSEKEEKKAILAIALKTVGLWALQKVN
jgi:hypothetical protein